MSSSNLKFSRIIIATILAIIISRLGISYLTILIAIGLILTILSKNKQESIITGVLYATVGYIISYPTGLTLSQYMPTTQIPVEVNAITVLIDLLIGLLVPIIVAIIICGISSIIGELIINYINKKENIYNDAEEHHFSNNSNKLNDNQKKDLLYNTPIQKAKLNRQKEKNEWYDD